jgi:hypothetical protein
LQSFSYRDPRLALSELTRTLSLCGCPLVAYKPLASGQMDLYFELPLMAALDAYAAMLEIRLELTQASHLRMTALCTLRQHRHLTSPTTIPLRLLVSFLRAGDSAQSTQPHPSGSVGP